MDKPNQPPKPAGTVFNKQTLSLSWNIATKPKLYQELATNPYSPKAKLLISERFPEINGADIVRAVVLAEPEGQFDLSFNHLSKAQQDEELSRQNTIFIEIHKRLTQSCFEYAPEFRRLPSEFAYGSLSLVAFETANLKEIEQKYSQSLRQKVRLLIVDLIENIPKPASDYQRKDNTGLFKTVFTALSVILILYFINGLYQKQISQKETLSATQYREEKKQALAIETQEEDPSFPVRLIIPVINVDAVIQQIGITTEREIEAPNNTYNVGWFSLGPRPGEKGNAVIAGHFNGENGEAGVFTDLNKLKMGDKLYITNSRGNIVSFMVRESRIYNPGYVEEVFFSSDSAHLNLVTCDGVWDGTKKSYSKRLVVFTDMAN